MKSEKNNVEKSHEPLPLTPYKETSVRKDLICIRQCVSGKQPQDNRSQIVTDEDKSIGE